MKSKIKLRKVDRRHVGYPRWKYFVEQPVSDQWRDGKTQYYLWRTWCWEVWGPSKELQAYDSHDTYDGVNCSNGMWCWLSDQHRLPRIYLRGDSEASAFTLQWI